MNTVEILLLHLRQCPVENGPIDANGRVIPSQRDFAAGVVVVGALIQKVGAIA